MEIQELIEMLKERLGDEEWIDYEADAIEWAAPRYCHQN